LLAADSSFLTTIKFHGRSPTIFYTSKALRFAVVLCGFLAAASILVWALEGKRLFALFVRFLANSSCCRAVVCLGYNLAPSLCRVSTAHLTVGTRSCFIRMTAALGLTSPIILRTFLGAFGKSERKYKALGILCLVNREHNYGDMINLNICK